jgi:hypothetical protein
MLANKDVFSSDMWKQGAIKVKPDDTNKQIIQIPWYKSTSEHKEIFSVYGGKCLSRKAVHNLVTKFSQGLSRVTDDETEVRSG